MWRTSNYWGAAVASIWKRRWLCQRIPVRFRAVESRVLTRFSTARREYGSNSKARRVSGTGEECAVFEDRHESGSSHHKRCAACQRSAARQGLYQDLRFNVLRVGGSKLFKSSPYSARIRD